MRTGQYAPILTIQNLAITYNQGEWNERVVIKDTGLTLNSGDLVILRGANGSGKSTFIRALSGDLSNVEISGKVLLDGEDLFSQTTVKRASNIGIIDQDPTLGTCANLLVHEQLSLAGKDVAKRIMEKIEDMGSSIDLRQSIQSLSGGQRQLLTTLLVLERNPRLLLADEPTAALDPVFNKKINALLEERVAIRHGATIVITHAENEPEGHESIRKFSLDNGKLVETQ
ncbi:MAG: ATP-binding cassette domain-containing protein [Candidatus Thiodiazotropha sp. DIVDIV]